MADVHTQACPLCSNLSNYEFVQGGGKRRKFFSCDVCSEFLITPDAEAWLAAQPRKCEELSNLSTFLFGDLVLHIFMESDGETRALLAIPDAKANWVPSGA
jgi:hypothetical protein